MKRINANDKPIIIYTPQLATLKYWSENYFAIVFAVVATN